MRALWLVAAVAVWAPFGSALAETAQAVKLACDGPEVAAARKIALRDQLKIGSDPGACFGRFSIYGGSDKEIVAVAPSSKCPGGKALEVYNQSKAGPWYSFFEQPVCGASVARGPKNQWGDWTLAIDGRLYESRGAFYVPVK